jgi:hypothetical protein
LTTRWAQALGAADPSWAQVDLGSAVSVRSVVATFELSSGYRYLIQYSTDGSTWSTFADHTGSATTQQINVSTPAAAVTARYLRLTVTNSNWNGGSLYELQAYSAL